MWVVSGLLVVGAFNRCVIEAFGSENTGCFDNNGYQCEAS